MGGSSGRHRRGARRLCGAELPKSTEAVGEEADRVSCPHPDTLRILNDINTQFVLVNAQFREVNQKLEKIIMSQSDIDAATSALTSAASTLGTITTDLTAAVANITAEIAALKAANPSVDTTALNAAVAGIAAPLAALQSADTAVDALETPPPHRLPLADRYTQPEPPARWSLSDWRPGPFWRARGPGGVPRAGIPPAPPQSLPGANAVHLLEQPQRHGQGHHRHDTAIGVLAFLYYYRRVSTCCHYDVRSPATPPLPDGEQPARRNRRAPPGHRDAVRSGRRYRGERAGQDQAGSDSDGCCHPGAGCRNHARATAPCPQSADDRDEHSFLPRPGGRRITSGAVVRCDSPGVVHPRPVTDHRTAYSAPLGTTT